MIYQLARTQVRDHIISTIYCPGLGFKGRDIYQTVIVTTDLKKSTRVDHEYRSVTNNQTLAYLSHEDAVTLAIYILETCQNA